MSVKCYRSFSGQPLTAALGSLSPVDTFTPVANEPRVFVSSEGLDADSTTIKLRGMGREEVGVAECRDGRSGGGGG